MELTMDVTSETTEATPEFWAATVVPRAATRTVWKRILMVV